MVTTRGFKEYIGTDREIIDAADTLLSGRLHVGLLRVPAPEFSPDAIGDELWRMSPQHHANTFSLYLLGLRPAYLLARAAVLSRDTRYLPLADELVRSADLHLSSESPADMAFNDHAISERVENMAYLVWAAADLGFSLRCLDTVESIMARDIPRILEGRYQRNHNHGIMSDRSVMIATLFLDNGDSAGWFPRVVERLRRQVEYAYGSDGVHCENSFDYHMTVTVLLSSCVEILKLSEDPYATELQRKVEDACTYIAYALKPNGRTPLFGDSKGTPEGSGNIDRFLPFLKDPKREIEYVLSAGSSGTRPAELLKRFASGYAFLRESFDPSGFADATWISLRAGYTTRTHKQRDDLALGLYSKGHDIFVDSGMAGYMPDDPVNRHMASIEAHTTMQVDSVEYSVARGNGRRFRFIGSRQGQNWDYVGASSTVVPGVTIYRHLYYLRQFGVLVLRDECIADDSHRFTQFFKLSPDVSLKSPEGDWVTLAIGDSGFVADLVQLAGDEEMRLHVGRSGTPMSVLSTGFGTTRPTQTLSYRKSGSRTDFVTCIRIREQGSRPVQLQLEEDRIGVGDVWLPRAHANPPHFYGAEVTASGSELHVHNRIAPGSEQFSAYLFREDTGTVLQKLPYTADPMLTLVNKERVDCVLMYYVRSGQTDTREGILASCRYVDGIPHVTTYDELHVPKVVRATHRHVEPSEHQFRVDLSYDRAVTARWWVYRDGANVDHIAAGPLAVSFTLDHPGSYVVMWSLNDPIFGEFAFEQFDPVVVA